MNNIKNVPKIRFKGYYDKDGNWIAFTHSWERRDLGDITEFVTGKSFSSELVDDGSYIVMDMGSVSQKGYRIETKRTDTHRDMLCKDDLIMPKDDIGGGLIIGRTVYIPCDNKFVLGDHVYRLRFFNESGLFVHYRMNSYGFRKQILPLVTGSAQLGLNSKSMQGAYIRFPSYLEQVKIGEYFSNLDNLIIINRQKCNIYKKLKKCMLQKMFPKEGETVPEIRFKGCYDEDGNWIAFTHPWEQRKFGEITELKSASRVHKDEWTSNGVPFYRSSDVMAAINGTENEKAFISEELYKKLSKVSGKLEEGDILVTGGGSVGNPYIVPDNKPLYTKDADLLWIKNKGKFHPYFLYEFFFSPTFRNYLGSISHVGTIAHYTITQLSDTPICLSSFEEQKEVGEYFKSLDHLITLHQRKCDTYEKLKKCMLQKMFV